MGNHTIITNHFERQFIYSPVLYVESDSISVGVVGGNLTGGTSVLISRLSGKASH